MMNVVDLRELIQGDIITCVDSHFGEVEYVEEVKTQLCQIVVDRINEYEKMFKTDVRQYIIEEDSVLADDDIYDDDPTMDKRYF
jgi:uncharacterized Fe-S center protein